MATSHDHHGQPNVNAAFLCNQRGDICIAFDDPAYVRSDTILIDPEALSVHAVLHEAPHLLGHVSREMCKAFERRQYALLTSIRPDGTIFELVVPIAHIHQH